MTKIITIVGASIFYNYLKNKSGMKDTKAKDAFDKLEEEDEKMVMETKERWEKNIGRITTLSDQIEGKGFSADINLCAEIQSSLRIAQDNQHEEIQIFLLATDTMLSRLAAELIVKWFKKHQDEFPNIKACFVLEKDVIKDLQVQNYDAFKENGIQHLIKRMLEIRDEDDTEELIINISGGYKGILPILTIFGQLYGIHLIYQYEESDKIMEISRMPVHFDWRVIEKRIKYLTDLNRIPSNATSIVKQLKNFHLIQGDHGNYTLTIIGSILAEYIKTEDVPFINDILGYLVEYKLFEYHLPSYPQAVHGYKPFESEDDWEDIDLLLPIANPKGFHAVEIKPIHHIKRGNFKTLICKLCERTLEAQKKRNEHVQELWGIFYSTKEASVTFVPTHYQTMEIAEKIILEKIGRKVPLKVKYFYIPENLIDGSSNRMRYHNFMRTSAQELTVTDLYPIQS